MKMTVLVVRVPARMKQRIEKAGRDIKAGSTSDAARQIMDWGLLYHEATKGGAK